MPGSHNLIIRLFVRTEAFSFLSVSSKRDSITRLTLRSKHHVLSHVAVIVTLGCSLSLARRISVCRAASKEQAQSAKPAWFCSRAVTRGSTQQSEATCPTEAADQGKEKGSHFSFCLFSFSSIPNLRLLLTVLRDTALSGHTAAC
jgi:hypothetical protein